MILNKDFQELIIWKEKQVNFKKKLIIFYIHKILIQNINQLNRNFKRERVYVHFPDQQWQADLAFLTKYSKENKGYKYFLSVIDCFSKYAWAFPLKNKKPEGIVESFKIIFKESGRKPLKLQTDEGTEFKGVFKKFCGENNIIHFWTQNRDIKAQIVERFNRTIEERMEKIMTQNNNNIWISNLSDLMKNYNNSYHRSIKMTPIEASKKQNQSKVHQNLFPERLEIYPTEKNSIEKTKI